MNYSIGTTEHPPQTTNRKESVAQYFQGSSSLCTRFKQFKIVNYTNYRTISLHREYLI